MSAPDVEGLVCEALRRTKPAAEEISDKDLVAQRVGRVTIHQARVRLTLRADEEEGIATLSVPFTPTGAPRTGIIAPADAGTIDTKTRETILRGVARAKSWITAIVAGKRTSLHEIAAEELVAERHVRRLALLAFVAPAVIEGVMDGTASPGLTVSSLTNGLPQSWSAQIKRLGT